MAAFTVDGEGVSALLSRELEGIEEDIVDYLANMVIECDEPGENGEGFVELIAPFVESYGLADSEEEATVLAQKLCKTMLDDGVVQLKQQKAKDETKLAAPIQASALEEGDGDDTWGLKDVRHKNKANTTVDSISDALGNRKNADRMAKKAEKERLKEEARVLREDEQRKREFESTFEPANNASTKNMTQNVRNRSMDVYIPNVNISVGAGKLLLDDAELRIVNGRRYGLIGNNGCGKSTLLNAISRGALEGFPTYLSVVHVEQEVRGDDTQVVDFVLAADKERTKLLGEEKDLLSRLEEAGSDATSINEKLRVVYEKLAAIDAESAEARARTLLSGLGFSNEMQNGSTKSLSGGWRMRVALATALFLTPDILLLDEPTNHLDLNAVLFLERFLQRYPKTFLLVSHDRIFTNNVITDVIHLENQKLNYYKGDIDIFEQTRENQKLQQQREYESQQNRRQHMQKFVDKFRFNAKRASLAQSRIKALNKMKLVDEVVDDPEFRFSFPEPASELSKVIEVQSVSFGYPKEDGSVSKVLFDEVDMSVHTTSRIVLLGPNGCGKSTFVSCLLDKLEPLKGHIVREPKLRIGYFAQHHVDQLDVRLSPLDYLLQTFPGTKPDEMRPHLARYGIPADLAVQRIGTMSGGQKSRVAFAKITWERPHLLIMDEPSNHLDVASVEALIIAINMFEGGVVLVSHDQYLIEMCAEEIWVVHEGKLTEFKGNFQEFKKWALPDDA
mmetsp:Transcript_4567/g.8621  ORF Transcript_4567/g.8621 Transcript_4567/m.8621 type:complete len:732 (-) Transcript_4567:377-2572(-)